MSNFESGGSFCRRGGVWEIDISRLFVSLVILPSSGRLSMFHLDEEADNKLAEPRRGGNHLKKRPAIFSFSTSPFLSAVWLYQSHANRTGWLAWRARTGFSLNPVRPTGCSESRALTPHRSILLYFYKSHFKIEADEMRYGGVAERHSHMAVRRAACRL